MQLSGSAGLLNMSDKAEDICSKHSGRCTDEYKGLLMLAATTLRSSSSCAAEANGDCIAPKRCQVPWLVRTNFADMARFVSKEFGDYGLQKFSGDVLQIW